MQAKLSLPAVQQPHRRLHIELVPLLLKGKPGKSDFLRVTPLQGFHLPDAPVIIRQVIHKVRTGDCG
ncbi:hypothetical protein D3C75_1228550 [compost metagenome]